MTKTEATVLFSLWGNMTITLHLMQQKHILIQLKQRKKEFITFEKSAHYPQFEREGKVFMSGCPIHL